MKCLEKTFILRVSKTKQNACQATTLFVYGKSRLHPIPKAIISGELGAYVREINPSYPFAGRCVDGCAEQLLLKHLLIIEMRISCDDSC